MSQYRLDEFSIVQERDPNTVSHLKDQIRELQEQVNFMILTLGTGVGYPTFLISLLSLRVPGEGRAAILDCCVIHEMKWVFEETILKTYLLEKDVPQNSSKIRQIWHHHHHLDQTGNFMEKEKEVSQEPMTTIPIPCFQRRARCGGHEGGNYHTLVTGVQNHTSEFGTCSQNGMINYPGYQIPEMHLGKFPDPTEFQSWKVNFRTEVCSKAKDPRLAMQWIKEIETAKSIDDLMTPRSTLGRTDFPDSVELDAMMASPTFKRKTDCLHDL